jgi:hypothetical protein
MNQVAYSSRSSIPKKEGKSRRKTTTLPDNSLPAFSSSMT